MYRNKIWQEIMSKVGSVSYCDKQSIFSKTSKGYIVVEAQDDGHLQIQLRETIDPATIIFQSDLLINGKYVFNINEGRRDQIEKLIQNFISHLE